MKFIYKICIILLIFNNFIIAENTSVENDLTVNHVVQLDANRIRNTMNNNGIITDASGTSGLTWVNNSSIIYQSGLWIAGKVDETIRTAITEYSSELQPGKIIAGIPDDPTLNQYRIFKLNSGDFISTDYLEWPVGDGAPVNGDGTPKIIGKQTAWWVANDANPASHVKYGTQPLFIEEQVYAYCFDSLGIFQDMVIFEWTIINNGPEIDSTYIGFFSDPDLGNYADDFVGYDLDLSMGYGWNDGADDIFGINTPAVGYVPLRTPIVAGTEIGITAFSKYIAGGGDDWGDPDEETEAYNFMKGLNAIGEPYIDPTTGLVTTYIHPGDPVTGTGWIDPMSHPSGDRRFLMSSGPFTFAEGDTQTVSIAILIAQGRDYLNSISKLKVKANNIKNILIDEVAVDIIAEDLISVNETVDLTSTWVAFDTSETVNIYNWNFESKPGGSSSILSSTNLASTSFIPDVEGTYVVGLTIMTDGGISTSAKAEILAVDNEAPVADFSFTHSTVIWGESQTADGTLSTDIDGDSLSYLWSAPGCFMDINYEEIVDIIPLSSGEKTVTLFVSDQYQNSQISKTFNVEPKIENISVDYTYLDTLWTKGWFFPFFQGDTLLVPNSTDETIRVYNIGVNGINYVRDIPLPNISSVQAIRNNHLWIRIYRPTTGNAGAGSISIFSIGDNWQLTPVLTDYLPGTLDNYGISFINDYVLIRDQFFIYKTDFSDLSNPQVLTEISYFPNYIRAIAEVGQYIFLYYNTAIGEYYIDVRDKNTLAFIKTLDLPTNLSGFSIQGTLLFAGFRGEDVINIYGISDPLNPTLLSTINIPWPAFLPSSNYSGYSARYLSDSQLAIDVNNGFEIYDIQDTSNPVYKGSWYGNTYASISNNNGVKFLRDQPMLHRDDYSGINKLTFNWSITSGCINGSIIYNSATGKFNFCEDGVWVEK